MASRNDTTTITITATMKNGIQEISVRRGNAIAAPEPESQCELKPAKRSVGSSHVVSSELPRRRKLYHCKHCRRDFNSSHSYAGHYKKCSSEERHPYQRSPASSSEPSGRRELFHCNSCKQDFDCRQSYAGHYKRCTTGKGHPHCTSPTFSRASEKPTTQEGSSAGEHPYVCIMGVKVPINVKQGDGSVPPAKKVMGGPNPEHVEELDLSLKL